MKITRQRQEVSIIEIENEDWETIQQEVTSWVEFEDDMTLEEEKEFYQREIDEITAELPKLRGQRDGIQELIEYGLNAESDIQTLEAIQSQMLTLATRRKEIIDTMNNISINVQ